VLILAAVLLAGLAAALIALDTAENRRRIEADYRIANEALVLTFSRAARTALVRGETEFLGAAARMIIAGGGEIVQIVVGGEVVLLETSQEPSREPPLLNVAADIEPSGAFDRFDGRRLLDVIRPLYSTGPDPAAVGYVRVLFDSAIVAQQVRTRTLAASGIALVSAGGLLAGLWFALGRLRRGTMNLSDDWHECGGLSISRARKLVRIFDLDMTLTPKQFEMLACLADEPGRVFSDAELLEAIWATSAYANSSDVKQCIYTLRKRVGNAVADPHALIETVTGHGYRLVPPGDDQRLRPI